MKIAIVHDWLTIMGGSEKIIRIFNSLFPRAPIHTLVYNKKTMPEDFERMKIKTSFIQNLPLAKQKYQSYLPLMPMAVEQFDLDDYDVVLSSSTACSKGVITRSDTMHICYCNTPMRYAWDMYHEYKKNKSFISKTIMAFFMNYIRLWDRLSADRVDYFIANSKNVAKRIKKHYKRESTVIYPPVNTEFYTPSGDKEDYYMVLSRLVPYKKIDLVIEAFNKLKLPLKIIGGGSEEKRLKTMANSNIEFLGKLPDEDVREYYRKCKAFIFPGEEDFGITPVEAQACGRPVIAYGKGGALETIIKDVTGVFFYEQSVKALIDAIRKYELIEDSFSSNIIRENAERFSEERFREEIIEFIEEKYREFNEDEYGNYEVTQGN